MKTRMKHVISWILTLALVFGCLAGTGITVKAAVATIWSVSVSPESLDSTGGTVTVSINGEDLGENIWWRLREKKEDGSLDVVGNEVNVTPTQGNSTTPTFEVTIPENTTDKSKQYVIQVKDSEPTPDYVLGGYKWTLAKSTSDITVAAASGQTPSTPDKTDLKAAIALAATKNAADYKEASWAAMQEKLTAANVVDQLENATAEQISQATSELQAAITALVEKTAEITAVTATPMTVEAGGDTVTLAVTGTNMTENNWGVEVKRCYGGTTQEVSSSAKAGKATITEIRNDGAIIDISATGMSSAIDFIFSVGPKSGDRITEAATVTVTQAGKDYKTETVLPKTVEMADAHTVVATFEESIQAAKADEALKRLIHVTGPDNTVYALGENDTVTVDEHSVSVRYENNMEELLTSGSSIYIKEGALKLENDKVLADITWLITTNANISSIVLDKETFDNKGGTVTARLEGYKVASIEDSAINAAVYLAGETVPTEIEVVLTRDSKDTPLLTFTVPENKTDNTVSYWLSVKVSGTPVYEGASLNRAKRATVSVLPEGKTDKDVTLSMLTISGNNKQEIGDIRNITVNVSSAVGELKTELRLYGTNLDSKVTKVRAIDQNGVIWPVYDIPECDGTIRFVAIAGINKNGVFGDGNTQLIEVLPPRYVGPNMTYTLQVAIDGEHFLDVPSVQLTVNNENLVNDGQFERTGKEDIKTIIVKHVEQGTGKEISKADVYQGYNVSMLRGLGIQPKSIDGYKLVKSPYLGDRFISNCYEGDNNGVLTYEYTRTSKPADVKVSGIQITAVSSKIAAGKSVQLKAIVAPENATNKAVTWTSSNNKYASVSATGKVTLKKKGIGKTVVITATAKDGSGKQASYKIKIMKHAVKSVSLKAAKTVKAGKKVKVKASVKTTGKSANKKLKWTTSNAKYATVSSSGVVKTYKAGKGKTVKITAVSTDGSNKKKTIKIKIK